LAQRLPDGRLGGLEVDLCRALASAVLGSPDRMEFRLYDAPADFEGLKRQREDVAFLTGSEMVEHQLTGEVLPTATIFVESHAVMVPVASPKQHVLDLAKEGVCFLIGGSAGRSLEAYFEGLEQGFLRHPYSEEGEMADAYAVQRCHAIAGESTMLAKLRFDSGVNGLRSRLLPERLSAFPILASTSTADGGWSTIVAWTVATLVSGERPETRRYAGGAKAIPVAAAELGLDKEWQERVLGAVGSYGDIFERNLGKGSPLKLDRGLNANQLKGGLLLSPFVD
jgi:general L-amino acid transport system substrate-binding protein